MSNLELTEKELEKFSGQLSEVIDYNIEQLNKVDTENVEPLLNVSGLTSVYREDFPEPGLTTNQVLQNAPAKHNDLFEVKAILEDAN